MAFYHWPLLVPRIVLVFVAWPVSPPRPYRLRSTGTSAVSYARSAKVLELNTPALDTLASSRRLAGPVGLAVLIAAMLIGSTHLVALYAAMAQIGTEGNLGYLVPRVALSPATTAVWSVFCALSFPRALGRVGENPRRFAIAGLAAAVLLVAVSAGAGPWVCSLRA